MLRTTILILLAAVLVAAWAEMRFADVSKQHALTTIELGSVAARLDRLEPCYHTFSKQDAQDLIACLRLPKPSQRPCLDAIQNRFKR